MAGLFSLFVFNLTSIFSKKKVTPFCWNYIKTDANGGTQKFAQALT